MDPATIERSLQRRRILEELISTEESYIGDVRFLMNVCASPRRFSVAANTVFRSMSQFSPRYQLCRPACGRPSTGI
jgi:hypothetical protein